MIINDQGSIFIFEPESDIEYGWLMLSVDAEPWQWTNLRNLSVDHRCAEDLIEGVRSAGFVIELT